MQIWACSPEETFLLCRSDSSLRTLMRASMSRCTAVGSLGRIVSKYLGSSFMRLHTNCPTVVVLEALASAVNSSASSTKGSNLRAVPVRVSV